MIIKLSQAIGMKLCSIVKSRDEMKWLLVFEDNKFCQLTIEHGYEFGDEVIDDDLEFDVVDYSEESMLKAGLLDYEPVKKLLEEQEALEKKQREAIEEGERITYERLKAKFESR